MGRSEQSKSRTHLQNIGALAGKGEQGNESEEDAGRQEKKPADRCRVVVPRMEQEC